MTDMIRVLMVDDEERFRETTGAILQRRGFAVKTVGSGIEAVNEVTNNEFDVVVLDVQMPDMDGNEALREIKNIKPDLAVLMLTGQGTPRSALEGLCDGVADYLMKPCPIDFLAQKIREAFALGGGVSGVSEKEPRVEHIMVPLSSFGAVHKDHTVADALKVFLEGFTFTLTTSTVQEMVHRSILVVDRDDTVVGFITFGDLLKGLQPSYMTLLTDRPVMADTLHLESPSYSGMFTIMARDLAGKTVQEIMSETPPVIDADANLMEAAARLLDLDLRRLLVRQRGKIVGVIREQDLFFEMANIIAQYEASRAGD